MLNPAKKLNEIGTKVLLQFFPPSLPFAPLYLLKQQLDDTWARFALITFHVMYIPKAHNMCSDMLHTPNTHNMCKTQTWTQNMFRYNQVKIIGVNGRLGEKITAVLFVLTAF